MILSEGISVSEPLGYHHRIRCYFAKLREYLAAPEEIAEAIGEEVDVIYTSMTETEKNATRRLMTTMKMKGRV